MPSFFLLTVLALTAARGLSQGVTLPFCAQACGVAAATESGCSLEDKDCLCTNVAYLADAKSCLSKDCDSADQEEAIQYFEVNCGSSSSSSLGASLSSSSSFSGVSSSSSVSEASSSVTTSSSSGFSATGLGLNTAVSTTINSRTVVVASTITSSPSSSGPKTPGFNGSSKSFVEWNDVLKIAVGVAVGLIAMSQM